MNYYEINETAARRAHEANSYRSFVEGKATAEYRQAVDEAAALAEKQKQKVDPMYHEKIDNMLEKYSRKLADWYNRHFEIEARVPSMMVTGGGNFPTARKEKQNVARDRHMVEYRDIKGLLTKIRGIGTGGISADDENAIVKLEAKLKSLEESHATMKAVNAFYRKNKTLDGCDLLPETTINELKAAMSRSWRSESRPFESYALINNNQEIRRIKVRIAELNARDAAPAPDGWTFDGGRVEMNKEINRIQIIFDDKPDMDLRTELKSRGFRWAPSQGAWQRQLNDNGLYALKRIEAVQPQ